MAETKDFTCRACGAQFDSRDKLDQHNRREHGTQGQAGGGGQQSYGDSGTQRGGQQQPGQSGQQRGEGGQQGGPQRGEGGQQGGQRSQGGRQQGDQGYGEGTPKRDQGMGDSGSQRGGTTEPRDKRADDASDWEDER